MRSVSRWTSLRAWAKTDPHPLARSIRISHHAIRGIEMPVVPGVHKTLYTVTRATGTMIGWVARTFWTTPLIKSRLASKAKRLRLDGRGMPLITGPVRIELGEDVRLSTQTTISGRTSAGSAPTLRVGSNVDIGWQTTIAVGRKVIIGDDVRIAGRAFLAGYPGHPLDPVARASGAPDTEDQIGDIVLEPGVWLATGVTVSAGVTIGAGTVVAAGSVVTRDLPSGVLAAGAPARIVRPLSAGGATHPSRLHRAA